MGSCSQKKNNQHFNKITNYYLSNSWYNGICIEIKLFLKFNHTNPCTMKQVLHPSKKAIAKLFVLTLVLSFSFKITNAQTSPRWTSFSIEEQSKSIINLCWSVDQPKNNKEFIVQKSSDLKIWKVIGQIKNNTKENNADYRFNDKHLDEGMNYYRIQQRDIYGNISYSVLKVFDNTMSSELVYNKK